MLPLIIAPEKKLKFPSRRSELAHTKTEARCTDTCRQCRRGAGAAELGCKADSLPTQPASHVDA